MTGHLSAKLWLLLSFTVILTLTASCSGKQISATVGDESMTGGPSAEAELAEPAPEPSAEPAPSLEGTSMEEAEPGSKSEPMAEMEPEPMLEAEFDLGRHLVHVLTAWAATAHVAKLEVRRRNVPVAVDLQVRHGLLAWRPR